MRRARNGHDGRASKEGSWSMNPAQKALWYIESHLADELSLDEIAGVAGISRFHMVHAFVAATGLSLMTMCVSGASARRRARSPPARPISSISIRSPAAAGLRYGYR